MWKFIGILALLGGTAGALYSWVCEGKARLRRLEEIILFLQKSLHMMQKEKLKVADWFTRYIEYEILIQTNKDRILERILMEITRRLAINTYPYGQMVWEEVFREEEQNLAFGHQVLEIIVQAGNGFFGRSRSENIHFLEKSIQELEEEREKMIDKNVQERKVWLPVGMLGAVMLVIIFL